MAVYDKNKCDYECEKLLPYQIELESFFILFTFHCIIQMLSVEKIREKW